MLREIVLALTFASATSVGSWRDNGLTVHTQEGDVVGTFASPAVRRFLGIPFGVAKRWETPHLPPLRQKPFKALDFGDSCPQALTPANLEVLKLIGVDDTVVPESEDCLSVNVWAPSIQRKQKAAVMLWVYGGAFQFGTSNIGVYDGQHIVRDNDDVLVVSFNYRLNIFGFPSAPQLVSKTSSQNFGLLDLNAAVQWIYDNIEAFGGDPERITLFGQSAGAAVIDAYTFAYPNDTRVKGVIEMSGNLAIDITGVSSTNNTTILDSSAWNQVADAVGCGTATNAAQLACMKAIPFKTLENALITTNTAFFTAADGIIIFADSSARAAAGNFLHIPLLAGTVAHEGDIFVIVTQELIGFSVPVLAELFAVLSTLIEFTCLAGKTASDHLKAGIPIGGTNTKPCSQKILRVLTSWTENRFQATFRAHG
ncbi:Acetylcholinesterase [Hypsizygus marmoreus]|uniref:Carboxylic ester hydrolase n=1 Tax=Hypsizygus marmoreus TaxID=39966 RepID=A0A369K285_HYPMA|nr:Acetylcholinesterase [Hypsizygus marmoreus]